MSAPSTSIAAVNVRPLRRLVQLNVCLLGSLSGIVFAAAEGHPLASLSVPIAVVGFLLIDRRESAGLAPLWANSLGLAAFMAAGSEFFGESIEGRLLGFGHLLLYLGWILMLQHKERTHFWWLCALSVLQMATASVLTNGLWFPLTALLYIILALWTLSVFSLDRDVARSAGVERSARPTPGGRARDRLVGDARKSSSRSNVRTESAARLITPRFVMGVAMNGIVSLMLALAIFILTPRIWTSSFQFFSDSPLSANQPLIGFAEEVNLGDMGEILENPDIVLEVEFFNERTGEPLNVEETMARLGYDAPLFRGKVLGHYESGRWSTPQLLRPRTRMRLPSDVPLIRQVIHLHPIGTMTLFAAGRGVACRTEEDVTINHELFNDTFTIEPDRNTRRLLRDVFLYRAYSTLHGEIVPVRGRSDFLIMQGRYQSTMLALPREGLDRLEGLAKDLARPDDGSVPSRAKIAGTMVDYLRNSGDFAYSLNVSIEDPTIDPVEDFLFNRKQGHCEYYATALALMLRSVDIPSRLVSGFKGGEFNANTGRFEVRQLHAHAWVEALIDGEWVVLDATPAARDTTVASINTSLNPFARTQRILQIWWTRGLLMNQLQQRRAIYEPLSDILQDGFDSVRRVGVAQAIMEWLRTLAARPEEWISIRGFITVFVLGTLIAGLAWCIRRAYRLVLRTSLGRRKQHQQRRRIVAFYERFRRLVARHGFARDAGTTHREFAAAIERQWRTRDDIDGLAQLPTQLTEAFYRVRFGEHTLPEPELQEYDKSLSDLERWMSRNPSLT